MRHYAEFHFERTTVETSTMSSGFVHIEIFDGPLLRDRLGIYLETVAQGIELGERIAAECRKLAAAHGHDEKVIESIMVARKNEMTAADAAASH